MTVIPPNRSQQASKSSPKLGNNSTPLKKKVAVPPEVFLSSVPGMRPAPIAPSPRVPKRVRSLSASSVEEGIPVPAEVIVRRPREPLPLPSRDSGNFFQKGVSWITELATSSVMSIAVNPILKSVRERDENVIRAIVLNPDDLFQWIQDETPYLINFIKNVFPDFEGFLQKQSQSSENIVQGVMLRLIANLALKDLPPALVLLAERGEPIDNQYQLSSEQLMEMSFDRIMEVIGPKLNELDSEFFTHSLPKNLIISLVKDVFNLLLPLNDSLREWISYVVDIDVKIEKFADVLVEKCAPLADWLNGNDVQEESSSRLQAPLQRNLQYFIPRYLEKIGGYYLEKDKAFFKSLTKHDDLYEIVKQFSPELIEQMKSFIPEDSLNVLDIEENPKCIEKAIEALVMRGFYFLSQEVFSRQIEHGYTVSPDQFIQKISIYLSANLQNHFNDVKLSQEAQEGVVTQEMFYPASRDLIKLFLPNAPWLQNIIKRRENRFAKRIAQLHFSFYNATINDNSEPAYKARLRKVLWNRTAIRDSKVYGLAKVPENPSKEDSILAGIEPTVEQIYNFCSHSIAFIRKKGVSYLGEGERVLKLLQRLQLDDSLDEETLERLSLGFDNFLNGNNSDIKWFNDQFEHVLVSMLFKGVVNVLEKVPSDERFPIEKLLFKVFESVLEIGVSALPSVIESLNENALIDPNEESQLAFTVNAIAPVVNDFFDLFFKEAVQLDSRLEDHLPLPKDLQEKLGIKIRAKASTSFAKTILSLTSWIVDRKSSEDKLERLFKSKNPLKLCNLIQHATAQGIPYFLRKEAIEGKKAIKNYERITAAIMPFLAPFFSSDPKAPIDLKQQALIQSMIQGFLCELGENSSKELSQLMQFIGIFAETASMRFIINVFSRIKEMEKADGNLTSLLEDLVNDGTRLAAEHFNGIGTTKKKLKKSKPTRAEFIKEFNKPIHNNLLHPALKDELPDAPPGNLNKKAFFIDLADQIFNIFQIDENSEFPVPDYLKELTFDIQKKALPAVLESLCANAADVSTINLILIAILNRAVHDDHAPSVIDKLFPADAANIINLDDLNTKFKDDFQKDLQKNLEAAIEALVKMQPDRIPQFLVKRKILKEKAAEAVGQVLRAQIAVPETNQPISIVTILDAVIGDVIESLAPSEWDEELQTLIYKETTFEGVVKKNQTPAKDKVTNEPNLKRFFPKNEDVPRAHRYQARQKKQAEKNVPKFLRRVINDETDQIIIEGFIKWWDKREAKLRALLNKAFGNDYGPKIAKILIPITRLLLKYPIAFSVLVFNYTIWLIASQVLKYIFNKQTRERLKDVGIDIHDNAIYRGLELVVNRYAERLADFHMQDDELDDDSDFFEASDSDSLVSTHESSLNED